MSEVDLRLGRTGFAGALAALITVWALLGCVLLLLVAAMNVASVIGAMFGEPFPGDFEMTQVGVAVAAFAFLPFCQLTGANVTADIFTAKLSARPVAVLRLVASVVAVLFGLLLLSRMYYGMLDQYNYNYLTTILRFPLWVGFAVSLVSLGLLVVAALLTTVEDFKDAIWKSPAGD